MLDEVKKLLFDIKISAKYKQYIKLIGVKAIV